MPTGLYFADKRINVGSNRWGFKPEVGVSKRFNRIYAEAFSGVWFYTDNNDYVSGKTLAQEPVFSFQVHGTYYFKNRMGLSLSGNWFKGGQTVINGIESGALLNNWRVGGTWTIPVAKGHSLKLQFHTGAFTASGYDYKLGLLAYQYVFF